MNIFQDLNLLILTLVASSICILGATVYLGNRKSITAKTFFIFCVLTAAWGISNYFNYKIHSPESVIIWVLRLHIALSVWHAFAFFQLAHVFPEASHIFSRRYRYLSLLVAISSIVNLTPLSFTKITILPPVGRAAETQQGPGLLLFAVLSLFLVGGGLYKFIQKTRHVTLWDKIRFRLILLGALATFILILTFNLILPLGFNQLAFIPFSIAAILPFIILTAYAIIQHHLFDIKVIATELLTFGLWLALLIRTVAATSTNNFISDLIILVIAIVLGLFLIRSVRREVETREKMEEMAVKLEVANDELKTVDEAKSDFISIASHQLRTPLSIIKGYISMVREGTYGKVSDKLIDPLQKVYISNERLITLVADLLDLSRMERGKMVYDYKIVQMTPLVNSLAIDFKVVAEKKGLSFTWEPKKIRDYVRADENKIRQVILNLIDNAVKYTPHGSIAVTLEEEGNNLRFSVTDTGSGLSQEERLKLFQKFARGQSEQKTHTEGLGLGLYVAKLIAQAHRGDLSVDSPGKGKGSTFSLTLPIYSGSDTLVKI